MGHGNAFSHEPGKKLIHNGADDNASGVALLLSLARYFSKHRHSMDYSILFVCFSGHETGLHGSHHFVDAFKDQLSEVEYRLNFDMMGRLDTTAA